MVSARGDGEIGLKFPKNKKVLAENIPSLTCDDWLARLSLFICTLSVCLEHQTGQEDEKFCE